MRRKRGAAPDVRFESDEASEAWIGAREHAEPAERKVKTANEARAASELTPA